MIRAAWSVSTCNPPCYEHTLRAAREGPSVSNAVAVWDRVRRQRGDCLLGFSAIARLVGVIGATARRSILELFWRNGTAVEQGLEVLGAERWAEEKTLHDGSAAI